MTDETFTHTRLFDFWFVAKNSVQLINSANDQV